MYYHSTRDKTTKYTASQAILKGLAPDGGLFVPNELPDWGGRLDELSGLTYQQLCLEVICAYFEEFRSDEKLEADILGAFDKFSAVDVIEIKKADNYFMELTHGPTCAFKDFALSVLPFEIAAAKRAAGETRKIAVLTATSGDTGKAALEAFRGVDGFEIAVVYPKDGVSKIQEMQMNSTTEDNTFVCGLEGNFDDCQRLIKEMVARKYKDLLVTSANSINIARLVPQITYYFYAYFSLIKSGKIKKGEKVNFCVPTGNFGNILSAYMAKKMGLPVNDLICASNRNNILTDFFETGVYDRRRKFYLTQSPSMDILISSNFERFLWFVTKDAELVRNCMKQLNDDGYFDIKSILSSIDFKAGFADEKQTSAEIKRLFDNFNYLVDTHTAVASAVANRFKSRLKTVVVSTADPYKFCSAVLNSISGRTESADELEILDKLQQFSSTSAPFPLASLKNCVIKHNNAGNVDTIKQMIENFLEKTDV